MKKILCLVISVLMLLTFLPVSAQEAVEENILLSADNFTMPAFASDVSAGNVINGGTATGNLFKNSVKINGGALLYATANVYLAEAGEYSVWVLSANERDDTSYYATIGFDSEELKSLTGHKTHKWEQTAWTLTKGWHEIKIGMPSTWKAVLVNAVYITNTRYEPNVDTDDDLKAYHDVTKPVFSGKIETSFTANDGVTATFPAATDNGTVYYEYTAGGTTEVIDNIEQPVNVLGVSGDTIITLKAMDKWGNTAKIRTEVNVPRTKFMLTYHNFKMPNCSSWVQASADNPSLGEGTPWLTAERKYIKMNETNVHGYAEAKIYIEAEGDYVIWLLYGAQGENMSRYPQAGFDGNFNQTQYRAKLNDLGWDKNDTWHLTEGWHTLQLGLGVSGWNPTYVNAAYITADLTENVTLENDNALLAANVENSVLYNGESWGVSGLLKEGLAVEEGSVNITPVVCGTTKADATVTINGENANFGEAENINLNYGFNELTFNVSASTTDAGGDAFSYGFPVISTAKIVNHIDAVHDNKMESTETGFNGENIVYINSGSAKFYANGISGKKDVYVYAASVKDTDAATAASVTVESKNGSETGTKISNKGTAGWVKIGTFNFSGKTDNSEYVEITAETGKNTYIDSVKFASADEFFFASQSFETLNDAEFAKIKLYKQTETDVSPVALLAQYDSETNSLLNVVITDMPMTQKGIYNIKTNEITTADGTYVKLLIWDNLTNVKPLTTAAVSE